jgi:hypothetical protein
VENAGKCTRVTTDYWYSVPALAQMLAMSWELMSGVELSAMVLTTSNPWLLLRDDFKHGCGLTLIGVQNACFITRISYT